eukprot:c7376_g1_i1.p1 GENE.c7376_g1_i1~~c7376_g1_i1.p1  ORF type:complete len:355 (+),score=62.92 c7376_g1_i1:202-1266(+)
MRSRDHSKSFSSLMFGQESPCAFGCMQSLHLDRLLTLPASNLCGRMTFSPPPLRATWPGSRSCCNKSVPMSVDLCCTPFTCFVLLPRFVFFSHEITRHIFHFALLVQNPDFLLQRDADGITLAHWAAMRGHVEVLRFFVENGLPIDTPIEPDLMLPLHWACVQQHEVDENEEEALYQTILYLVEKLPSSVNALTRKGRSAAVLALQSGLTRIARFLVEHGTDLGQGDIMGDNILHWAAYQDNQAIVQLVYDMGLPLRTQDTLGQTALHIAAQRGNFHTTQYLATQGGDALLEVKDSQGLTALEIAVARGHKEVADLLQEAKNLNSQKLVTSRTEPEIATAEEEGDKVSDQETQE